MALDDRSKCTRHDASWTSPLPSPCEQGEQKAAGSADADGLNAPGRATLRLHPFDSVRFHVLLNSLFKVLFNFPSRYLSTIGLVSSI